MWCQQIRRSRRPFDWLFTDSMLKHNVQAYTNRMSRTLPQSVYVEGKRSAMNDDRTPLFWACQSGNTGIARVLLEGGATVDQARKDGQTPLYVACQYGHTDIVKALLAAHADTNQAIKDGATPLLIASWYGHTDIVKALLEGGATVDQARKDGQTPLYIAC